MTRRVRLWITAVLSIAATALMVGLTVAAQAGVGHAHTHIALAGIAFNAIDQAHRAGAAAMSGARRAGYLAPWALPPASFASPARS